MGDMVVLAPLQVQSVGLYTIETRLGLFVRIANRHGSRRGCQVFVCVRVCVCVCVCVCKTTYFRDKLLNIIMTSMSP